MMLSVCMLSWNRIGFMDLIKENLDKAGMDFELLICDQGTNNHDYQVFLDSLRPTYFRRNKLNEGIARSLNQLLLRASGKYIWFMPTDCSLPNNWAKTLIWYAERIPDLGILGFEGGDMQMPIENINGVDICTRRLAGQISDDLCVYGPILMTRELIKRIGYYHEGYHPYGWEDADICFRCQIAGLICGYIPNQRFEHIERDIENKEEYVIQKKYASSSGLGYHRWRANNYLTIGIYEPPPQLRGEFS